MSSRSENEIIHIVFTMEEALDQADWLGVDPDVARERIENWQSSMEDWAVEKLGEMLESVILHDTP